MANNIQKFHHGDLVQIASDLGDFMRHFPSGCRAIVIGSYRDQYGGGPQNSKDYSLLLEGRGECSWYYEHQLTLIERDQSALLDRWRVERDAKNAQMADMDWIFANGAYVLSVSPGASVGALGKHLGIDNMWGAHGEGMSLYANSLAVLSVAAPFLETGDKAGFLAFAQTHKLPTVHYKIS